LKTAKLKQESVKTHD